MPDDARDPDLGDLLALHGESLLDGVHTMLPGVIVSYDAAKQLADVQPQIKHRRLDEDGETVISIPYPVVHNCPVKFCGTARGRITWPVAAGDTCEISFASASIQRWISLGGLVDPGEDRRHDLTDGTCYVGLHDAAHVPTDAPTDAVVVHTSGGVLIKLGSSSAHESAVAGDTYLAAANTMVSAIGTVVAGLGAFAASAAVTLPVLAGAASTLAPIISTFATAITTYATAAANFKATKVKVE